MAFIWNAASQNHSPTWNSMRNAFILFLGIELFGLKSATTNRLVLPSPMPYAAGTLWALSYCIELYGHKRKIGDIALLIQAAAYRMLPVLLEVTP